MRVVPLKVVPFKGPGGAELPDLHYSEALVLIAKAPQGGITAEEMDRALAIEEAIEAAVEENKPNVMLEEADWTWLTDKIRANRWQFASRVFRTLIKDVVEARKIEPNRLQNVSEAAE